MKITIKNVYNDISLLYKNILHWNISKLIILIWGSILWILSIVPFAILFAIYSFFSWINFFDFINSWINWVFMTSLFWNLLYLISLLFFTLSYFFTFVLLINLYNSYLLWSKISYLNNKYLDYKLYFKYLLLSIYNFLILLIPVLIFILLIVLLIYFFWWIDNVTNLVFSTSSNAFSIISLILFIFLILTIYYISYRLVFSYLLLLEDKFLKIWIFQIIKESLVITSKLKTFFKFTLLLLIFLTAYLPISVLDTYINWNYKDLNNYSSYLNLNEEDKSNLKSINPYTYEWLDLKYSWKGVSEINSLENMFYIFSILFSIFKFIFIFWVFSMFLNSFYKRNILLVDWEVSWKLND